MANQPWPFDILTRVIKVVRATGAVFVSATNPNTPRGQAGILFNQMETDTSPQSWHVVHTVVDGSKITYLMCGAYGDVGARPDAEPPEPGTPTFVVGGRAFDEEAARETAFILTSNDGESWNKTHDGAPTANEVYVMGWNDTEKKFYAQSRTVQPTEDHLGFYEVLSSSDGRSWSVVETHTLTDDPQEVWASELLKATGTDLITDSNGNIVPNGGLFGWDKDRDIWIAPKPLVEIYNWYGNPDAASPSAVVEIIKKTVDPETGAVTTTRTDKIVPISFVICVGRAGDVWQAGGYEQAGEGQLTIKIATSIDDGETWEVSYSNSSYLAAACMLGAPASMFSE